jgi:hypothetical protein
MWKFAIIGVTALAMLFALVACDAVKDEVNSRTAKTETFDMDLTDDWVPLYAIAQGDYDLTAVCYAETVTIDALLGATDLASTWDSAKDYIDEIELNALEYRIAHNHSEGGRLDIYLTSSVPTPMTLPGEFSLDDLGLEDLSFILVDPAALTTDDRIGFIDIPAGNNVPDWSEASFVSGGRTALEDQLMDFDDPFAFCLRLAIPTHTVDIGDLEPDLDIKIRTSFDVTFTPL